MMKRLLPILLLLLSSAGLAEPGAYQVEVIVFRNLMVTAQATATQEPGSFSQFPDLEAARPPEDLLAGDLPEPPTGELANGLVDDSSADQRNDLPDDLHIISQKSPPMDAAWRRLRSSQGYRPLVYAAWQQNRIDYYPPIRIHNQQIIARQLRPPTTVMVADLVARDPLAAYRSTYYQLDGGVQLRRSRFLHLYLELEYREEKAQTETLSGSDDLSHYGVFKLKQNRPFSTGEMQYFDTPYLGALVFVSAVPAK